VIPFAGALKRAVFLAELNGLFKDPSKPNVVLFAGALKRYVLIAELEQEGARQCSLFCRPQKGRFTPRAKRPF